MFDGDTRLSVGVHYNTHNTVQSCVLWGLFTLTALMLLLHAFLAGWLMVNCARQHSMLSCQTEQKEALASQQGLPLDRPGSTVKPIMSHNAGQHD